MTIKIIIIIILIIIIRLIIIKLLKIKLELVVIFKTVIIIQTYHNIKIIIGDICSAKISRLLVASVLEVFSQQSMLHEIFPPHFVKVQILRIQRLTIVVFVKPKTDYASLLENKLASKNRTLPSSEKK